MAVHRIEKNKNYTCMSNHHLRNMRLSLKAKGLFSVILSLPDDWSFSIAGLAKICGTGRGCIRSALQELEDEGYVLCRRERNSKGQLAAADYTICEEPMAVPADAVQKPESEEPMLEKPKLDFPTLDHRPQLNTKILNTKRPNTDSIHLSDPSYAEDWEEEEQIEEITAEDSQKTIREKLKNRIEYQHLLSFRHASKSRLDHLVELMVDVLASKQSTGYIAGEFRPLEDIRARFQQLTIDHMEYVLDCLSRTTTRIRNLRQYMLTALFHAPLTMEEYYDNAVRHDLYGSPPSRAAPALLPTG